MKQPPRYRSIADDLRRRIQAQDFADGRLPSERQLALDYQVNRLTLRKAMGILHAERLIARLGSRGTFAVSDTGEAEQLRGKRIAFVLVNRDLSDPFHGMIASTLQHDLQPLGTNLVFHGISKVADVDALLAAQARYKELDGLVVDGAVTPTILKKLKQLRLPMVLIGCLSSPDPVEKSVDQVVVDPFDYTRRGVRELIGRGGHRIAFVDGPAFQWSMQSQQGYMSALEEAGIDYREELIVRCPDCTVADGLKAAEALMRTRPDALFVRSEKLARGVYDSLRERSVTIPGDLPMVVVGHPGDAIDHLGFTRIVLDPATMAKQALELLRRRICSPHAEVVEAKTPVRLRGNRGSSFQ
jgi:LacI family transcriptional regulator